MKAISKKQVSIIRRAAEHELKRKQRVKAVERELKRKQRVKAARELTVLSKEIQEKSLNKQFLVCSFSESTKKYDIRCNYRGVWSCDCANFVYKSSKLQATYGWACKHIKHCIYCVKEDTAINSILILGTNS